MLIGFIDSLHIDVRGCIEWLWIYRALFSLALYVSFGLYNNSWRYDHISVYMWIRDDLMIVLLSGAFPDLSVEVGGGKTREVSQFSLGRIWVEGGYPLKKSSVLTHFASSLPPAPIGYAPVYYGWNQELKGCGGRTHSANANSSTNTLNLGLVNWYIRNPIKPNFYRLEIADEW